MGTFFFISLFLYLFLQSKVPCIYATDTSDPTAPLRLVVSTGNLLSCETSKMLLTYSKIDARATKLATLFRYLGKFSIFSLDEASFLH